MLHIEFTVQRRHLLIIAALLAGALWLWPQVSNASHTFDDVPDDNIFHSDIDWLAANGITRGCNPPQNTKYCPGAVVDRQAMAAFMKRLATGGSVDAGALGGVAAADLIDRIVALEALLEGVSRNGDVLVFEGMNVQVINGANTTESHNGLGNIIIGYNEDTILPTNTQTGSHYLIVGPEHSFSGYGGIVAGYRNEATAGYASVLGGSANLASGNYATVTGGGTNEASGSYSSVTGGVQNTASGISSSVSGGELNKASGAYSSVSGGERNTASGETASASGGVDNQASGSNAAITAGQGNQATGIQTSVHGGSSNHAQSAGSSILGGFDNMTTLDLYTTIIGGDSFIDCYGQGPIACGEGSMRSPD